MAYERRSNNEWLQLARTAAGIPTLELSKLTIEDGVLTGLDLSSRRLTSLPESIGQLTSLSSLNLWGNQLVSLPESIGQLTKLTSLDLYDNQLASLPESIGQLTKLTKLNLRSNELASLPESIGQLTKLASFNLGVDDWLLLARTAAGIPYLAPSRLTIRDGVLTGLDLSSLGLTSLPESIRQLTSLTRLSLEDNKLASLPESIGQLTKLTSLNLYNNQLASLPESIGQLTKLTSLDLELNRLASLPESIGQLTKLTNLDLEFNRLASLPESIGQLTKLTSLDLHSNQLASLPESIWKLTKLPSLGLGNNQLASLPESIGQLTKLTELELWSNQLKGEVPPWFSQLVNLKTLDLSINRDLGGSLPSMTCHVSYQGTKISGVKIKTKPVKSLTDRLFVVAHVLMGYADLVTDVLSIVQFQREGNAVLMGLNVAFLLFNLCVDVLLIKDVRGRVLTVLQVQQAVQAYESLDSGRQTGNFVRSKKVDAVCRSVPSIVLQLYGLLGSLPTLRATGIMTLTASVAVGVTGSAMTLGSLAPKSGNSLFSFAFAVHFCYYVCELTVRLLSMSLLFVSIGPIALAVLGPDFLLRLFALLFFDNGVSFDTLMSALLLFGSDAIDGPTDFSLVFWSTPSSVVLLIALCLVNLLNTPTLAALRATHGGAPVQAVTALACVAMYFKYLIGNYIEETTFAQAGPLSKKEKKQQGREKGPGKGEVALPPLPPSRRARQNLSFDATYDGDSSGSSSSSSPGDRIPPSRLHAQHAGPGSASLAAGRTSTKAMTHNPLRPSTGTGEGGDAAPSSLQHGADRV